MDMVERVARGMYEAEPDAHRFPDWDKLTADDELRRRFLRQARAAIEAMREPTEAMLRSGTDHDAEGGGTGNPLAIYTAMIDAALSPNQKG
jgi:hypothetical protein